MREFFLTIIVILLLGVKSKRIDEIEGLRDRLIECDKAYKSNVKLLDSVLEQNAQWNDYLKRMKRIVGKEIKKY